MKLKQHNNISESQVEDSLVANLFFLQKILDLPSDLKLIERQLWLKSGKQRLDLLLSSGKDLCLVELKVTRYSDDFLLQTVEYVEELIKLQNQNNVNLIVYEPIAVLKNYYENLSAVAPFLKIKPNDYGVFSLGLINRALIRLGTGETNQEKIATQTDLSKQ